MTQSTADPEPPDKGNRDLEPRSRNGTGWCFPGHSGEHGPLYATLLVGWLLLTLGGFAYLLKDTHGRLEARFVELVEAEAIAIKSQLRANEAVIGGFASFLSALAQPTYKQASDYARNVLAGFPHIYMLETAEAVSRPNREQFRSSLAAESGVLTIRTFSYDTTRRFQPPGESAVYYPVTFIAPDLPEARPVLGLDLATVPHLRETLIAALSSPGAHSTRPFSLVEGDLAFVIMQQVPGKPSAIPATVGEFSTESRIALLVIRAKDLPPAQILRPIARTVWAMRDGTPVEPALLDLPEPPSASPLAERFLPRLVRDIDDQGTSQPIRLRVSRQMRFDDFDAAAWRSVTLVSVLSLAMILMYLRQHHQRMQRRDADFELARWGALHDPLTGLPNRQLLMDRLHRAFAAWRRANIGFALLFIDLDHFKDINDTYGHEAGDAVLNAAASRLESVTREIDTVARYAGDEFVVLAAQLTDRNAIATIADKIRFALAQPIDFDGQLLNLTASLGIAICPDDGYDPETLIRAADRTMYGAKRHGRNAFEFCSRTPQASKQPRAVADGTREGRPIRLVR